MERMELEYDKALLVLHPLGISVTSALFVSLLNSNSIIRHRGILLIAWLIWIVGVIFTLFSFVLSSNMHKLAAFEWRANREPSENPTVRRLGFWTDFTTYGSGVLFVIGIIAAAVFLIALPMSKHSKDTKRGDHIEKGNSLAPSPKQPKVSTTSKPQPTPQKETSKK
jgi:hypothetical protein